MLIKDPICQSHRHILQPQLPSHRWLILTLWKSRKMISISSTSRIFQLFKVGLCTLFYIKTSLAKKSIGGPIPTLVGRPLPANFVVADALAPFAAPAIGDNGLCRSKYPDRPDYNAGDQNVRDTDEWENYKKDPVFSDLPSGGNVILLSVLDLIYRPTRVEELTEADDIDVDNNRSPNRADDIEQQTLIDSPRNSERGSPSIDEEKRQTERERSLPYSPQELISETATENVSVSHGPTGHSKPITLPPRPYPPPTPQDKSGDNKRSSRSQSASPRRNGS